VYNKPMIFYPIETLAEAGINEILIVAGGNNAGDFLRLLRNGNDFGLNHLGFAYQEGEGGIAAALSLAKSFANGESVCVILGDNIVQDSIRPAKETFEAESPGSMLLLKQVPDPERFGVPVFDGGRLTRIEEKPKVPASPFAVVGIYFYDHTVFDRIATLQPSSRGELEITDVNNSYLADGQMSYEVLNGWWTDAGTFESLWHASSLVKQKHEASHFQAVAAAGGGR
jgi:glucose-1-phosphate thymidylyltransferase